MKDSISEINNDYFISTMGLLENDCTQYQWVVIIDITFSLRRIFDMVRIILGQPNQELSGAKFELQRKTVGVCSSYRRVGQLPYNSALRVMQMCLHVHINKGSIYEYKIL